MLNAHEPIDIHCWDSKGQHQHYPQAIPLALNPGTGCRNIKLLPSGEIRKIRECLIFMINGIEIYL